MLESVKRGHISLATDGDAATKKSALELCPLAMVDFAHTMNNCLKHAMSFIKDYDSDADNKLTVSKMKKFFNLGSKLKKFSIQT